MDIEWRACSAIRSEAFRRGLQYPLLRVKLEKSKGIRHFLIDFDEDGDIDRETDVVEEVGGYDFDVVMDRTTHSELTSAKMIVNAEGELRIVMEEEDADEVHIKG